jgi:hypothetical protein
MYKDVNVKEALLENCRYELIKGREFKDIVKSFSKNEVFDMTLRYNGFIGYTETIKRWIKDIYGVDLDKISDKNLLSRK